MGALALNLAHEIRNPLNAALLQLHLLGRDVDKLSADDLVKESLKRRAAIVGDEVGRLNRLLTEFLELARPRGIAREPVHIGTIVGGVIELQQGAALGRGVRLQKEIAADGCVALGDAEKLTQVVLNLVVNALEAMKSGGTLTARVFPEGDRVLLEISDTGPGIPDDVLENVFDPFFTTKEAGTGLGLSIVRKIVDQHGGDVQIRSESEGGTRVTVRIPTGR
jgi:signal transduction histidine kinase